MIVQNIKRRQTVLVLAECKQSILSYGGIQYA